MLRGALRGASWAELSGSFWTASALLASIGCLLVLATRPEGLPSLRSMPAAFQAGPGSSPSPTAWAVALLVLGGALVLQPLGVLRVLAQTRRRDARASRRGVVALRPPIAALRARSASAAYRSSDQLGRGVAATSTAIAVGRSCAARQLRHRRRPRRGAGRCPDGATGTPTCNGHVELCARRYDEVAFPATHNAMAAADQPGWFFAEQPDGILSQLDHGIRVLLIDSWYGQRTSRPRRRRQHR